MQGCIISLKYVKCTAAKLEIEKKLRLQHEVSEDSY